MPHESTCSIHMYILSHLKPFSSGAVYEFATMVYFLSSVTDFAELAHNCTTESEMDLNYH